MNRSLTILLCAWLLGCAGAEPLQEQDPFIPGARPLQGVQLELPRLGGGTFSLSTLQGRPVLLFLFTTWSLRAQAEAPLVARLHEIYHPRGLEVVGIALEQIKPQLIRDYADYVGFRFSILLSLPHDPPLVGAFGQTFHVPRTLLLDRQGRKVLDLQGQADQREVEAKIKQLLPPAGRGDPPVVKPPPATRKKKAAVNTSAASRRLAVKSGKRRVQPMLSVNNFQAIKQFILQRGDRQTYCNMYNQNPHYAFQGFEAYLHPEGGQTNINCDPKLSDFDELVISDQQTDQIYFRVKLDPKKPGLSFKPKDETRVKHYFKQMMQAVRSRP